MPDFSNRESPLTSRDRSSKQISVFIPSLSVGGAERVTINLAEALNKDGFEVDLLVADSTGEFADSIREDINIIELNNAMPLIGILGVIPSLRNYLSQSESATLISSLTRTNVTTAIAQKISSGDVSCIGIEHLNITDKEPPLREKIIFTLARFFYPQMSSIVAVSEGVADSIVKEFGIDERNIIVIPNIVVTDNLKEQIDTSTEHRWATGDFELIVSLGRLSDQKDYPTLLNAFSRLKNDTARLLIIGEGELKDELIQQAHQLNIQDRVEFTGYVDNPYKYIADASLFVLSSKREGLPTVLIEALGCGCPIVSTDSPSGPKEVLDFGRYGYLVPVGDPDRLAGAIDAELSKAHDKTVLLQRANYYSAKTVVPRFKQLM